jgi:hypothetical protein
MQNNPSKHSLHHCTMKKEKKMRGKQKEQEINNKNIH